MFMHHIASVHRDQMRVLELLELEIQVAMSYHMGAGNRIWVPWKMMQCS